MKGRRSHKNSTPHGGVIPILKKIKEFGIPQVIRKCLGERNYRAVYGYEDIFIAWMLTSLCGGRRLDHITKLKKKLSIIPGLKLPSHDTLGRAMKALATETKTSRRISKNGKAKISYTRFNDNIELNKMLIKATIRMGLLKKGQAYKLDIDATFVPTKCYDALKSENRRKYGYSPMVCLIGNLPVFISMRSGNASAAFDIANCLAQCINLLEENGVKVSRVISDAAGQNKELLESLDRKGIKYNVRMPFKNNNSELVTGLLNAEWRETEIKTTNSVWNCEIASFPYKMHNSEMNSRIVCLKVPDKKTKKMIEDEEESERRKYVNDKLDILDKNDGLKKFAKKPSHSGWVNYKGYDYKLVITNDLRRIPEELILEYNKRGGAERNFEYMKNEFAWELPPFMNMNENTIFLIATSLTSNIFRAMVRIFKKIVPELRLNARLPDFRFVFINVSCEYIDGYFDFGNVDIPYEKLM